MKPKTRKIQCNTCKKSSSIPQTLPNNIRIKCPFCGQTQRLQTSPLQKKKQHPRHPRAIPIRVPTIRNLIIETILLCIGVLYLIQPTPQHIKNGLTLILIATFLLFLMSSEHDQTKKQTQQHSTPAHDHKHRSLVNKIRCVPLTNRIGIVLIGWTLLLFMLTQDIEVYFILLFIGVLITREITDKHTSNSYKKRLNAYIIVFLILYLVLLSQKIIEIVST